MSIADNIAAARLGYFGSWWQRSAQRDAVADGYRHRLKIAAPDVRKTVEQLSGGNQQKVVLSKSCW